MRSATVFNIISILFFLATVVVIAVVAALLLSPSPQAQQVVDVPTLLPEDLFPTDTPTFTHTPSATVTPPPTFTPTATDTATVTASVTPSDTPTNTFTPSITPIPSETFTPEPDTPTPSPTGPTATQPPTLSPYLFGQFGDIRYSPNFANALGCSWQGVGGQVFGMDDLEVIGGMYQVRVYGGGIENTVLIGTNSIYGAASGWEVQVASSVNNIVYFVRLETINGTQISEDVQVPFFNDCSRNIAIVDFKQLREP